MTLKNEMRILAWLSVVLGAIGLGVPILSVFSTLISRSISMPIYTYVMLVAFLGFVTVLLYRNYRYNCDSLRQNNVRLISEHEHLIAQSENAHSAAISSKDSEIERLTGILKDIDSFIFVDGAYYRNNDLVRVQPFCRGCFEEKDRVLTTVQIEHYKGGHRYYCRLCQSEFDWDDMPF